MEIYHTVARHIVSAIRHGNLTIGGIMEYTGERYGDTREMVNLVLGMLVERGVLRVTPTGIDRHTEPLPVAWWSVTIL